LWVCYYCFILLIVALTYSAA